MNTFVVSTLLLIVCIAGASSLLECYFCANCPYPFNPYGYGVTKVYSNTGFCLKQSTSSAYGAPASRGAAPFGLCNYSGCGWSRSQPGVYACCCQSNDCNAGNLLSKSTISVLLGVLTVFIAQRVV